MDETLRTRIRTACAGRHQKPVALVAKYDTWGFLTDLEALDLSGYLSILLLRRGQEGAFGPAVRRRFDLVLPLESTADFTNVAVLGELGALRLPEIEALLEVLLEWVPARDVHLVGLEEELLRALAALRERFDLPGPRPPDIQRFLDKSIMKACFARGGVPAPASELLAGVPAGRAEVAALQASVEERLQFPLFVKPSDGVASIAAARLDGPSALADWLEGHRGITQEYVLDTFIVGTEIFAYGLVCQGELDILSIDEMYMPMFEAREAGEPIAELSLDRASPEFARVAAFSQEVFRAASPVPDGAFVAQLMRSKADGRLYAIEMCARVPGDIAPRTLLWASGVNVEAAHIALQLPNVRWMPAKGPRRSVATLLFPKRAGTVRAVRSLPPLHPDTEVLATWHVRPGERLEAPKTYDEVACYLQLGSNDHASLARDYAALLRFCPLLLEGELLEGKLQDGGLLEGELPDEEGA